jgi:hypothetical protein
MVPSTRLIVGKDDERFGFNREESILFFIQTRTKRVRSQQVVAVTSRRRRSSAAAGRVKSV